MHGSYLASQLLQLAMVMVTYLTLYRITLWRGAGSTGLLKQPVLCLIVYVTLYSQCCQRLGMYYLDDIWKFFDAVTGEFDRFALPSLNVCSVANPRMGCMCSYSPLKSQKLCLVKKLPSYIAIYPGKYSYLQIKNSYIQLRSYSYDSYPLQNDCV